MKNLDINEISEFAIFYLFIRKFIIIIEPILF